MRRFFGYLVRLLVLVVVFMVSALTAMRFAIHGRQTTVPKITGMTTTEARRALSANGLVLDTTDRFYSSEVQEGRILSQVPAPGGEVRRGWRVRVAESLGPLRVVIPDLIGGSERAADINIRRRGLELGNTAIATVPYAPADQIVGQSPSANAANVSAPKVSVLLAAPEDRPSFVMPDLTGRNENDVVNLIVAAGMRVGNISSQAAPADGVSQSNGVPSGLRMVVHTSPAAGQRVYEGQAISLEVTR